MKNIKAWSILISLAIALIAGCGIGDKAVAPGLNDSPRGDITVPLSIHLDQFESMDIPGSAKVYGLGDFFLGFKGTFESKVYLCKWEELPNFQYHAPVVNGAVYHTSLYVEGGYFFLKGIKVLDTPIEYFEYDGASPYGHVTGVFYVTDNQGKKTVGFPGEKNISKVFTISLVYKGGDIAVPEECKERAEPKIAQSCSINAESNLFWGQSFQLYWDSVHNYYCITVEVLALSTKNNYYVVMTCSKEVPYRRTFGVFANETNLVSLYRVSNNWLLFVFDLDSNNVILQDADNRCLWT